MWLFIPRCALSLTRGVAFTAQIYVEAVLGMAVAIAGVIFGSPSLKPLKLVDQPVTRYMRCRTSSTITFYELATTYRCASLLVIIRTFEMAQSARSDFNIFNHRGRAIQQRLAAAQVAQVD